MFLQLSLFLEIVFEQKFLTFKLLLSFLRRVWPRISSVRISSQCLGRCWRSRGPRCGWLWPGVTGGQQLRLTQWGRPQSLPGQFSSLQRVGSKLEAQDSAKRVSFSRSRFWFWRWTKYLSGLRCVVRTWLWPCKERSWASSSWASWGSGSFCTDSAQVRMATFQESWRDSCGAATASLAPVPAPEAAALTKRLALLSSNH